MTDMLTHEREHDTTPPAGNRIRLAVREVRETAFRALYAAGVAPGEAGGAADVVTAMQLHARNGIDTLLDTIADLDSPPTDATLTRGPGVDIVERSPRSALLTGPLAVDLALTQSRPVLLPRIVDHHAVAWYALHAVPRSGASLWLITLDDGGRPAHATVVTGAGEMYRNVSPVGLTGGGGTVGEFCAGTLLRTAPLAAHTARPVHTAADRETRYRHAVSYGVFVDASTWSRAYALGRRFLVPEAPRD
ncbi:MULTISPECIES: hypothetical protein [unclassified Rhodococcus (in: high G+C Gram-positive bacteria)]|uniref:hypothetical protein n=1 Tax=unclassified Rhodococcus (in: high G+C Gram-positive bacteria) TaxID=192944 RepID=UPI00163AE2EC|nr:MULTISPECIES: hypothetical protein [unclassified Rhodococcus (in: high G+C Gram-positive bacteria)]MBC2641835.1 hypothetical protein [Rhodococcus sp. 3A]MBC2893421.1 hypothetical protein [Rhodococcus sp. 4CII]